MLMVVVYKQPDRHLLQPVGRCLQGNQQLHQLMGIIINQILVVVLQAFIVLIISRIRMLMGSKVIN